MKLRTIAMLVGLTLAGCGDDDDDGETATTSTSAGGTGGSTSTGMCCDTTSASSGDATATSTTSAAGGTSASSGTGGDACACAEPVALGTVTSDDIDEASGIAASRKHAGVYYVHNDSGDDPRFFAIDSTGALLATYELDGANAIDWEDMAAGPCQNLTGACLYFADFGDNNVRRDDYRIYRVAEPNTITAGTHTIAFETLPFTYPDGSHNAETLLVHPTTGELAIVQKTGGAANVYTLAAPAFGAQATFTAAGSVSLPGLLDLATGGDVRADGTVLVRTYQSLYRFAPGASIGATLQGVPCTLPVASEGQGEAVAWSSDGMTYVTLSEGENESLFASTCGQ